MNRKSTVILVVFLILVTCMLAYVIIPKGSYKQVATSSGPVVVPEVIPAVKSPVEVSERPSVPAIPAFCKESVDREDFQAILHAMDFDLDQIAIGKESCGSFTDYFIPNAIDAIRAGASKRAVYSRINRAVTLAEKGIFLSSYEAEIVRRNGPIAVREYADAALENVDVLAKEKGY